MRKCSFKGTWMLIARMLVRSTMIYDARRLKYTFLSFENFLIDISYIYSSINLSPFSPARSRYLYAVAMRDVQSVGIDPARPFPRLFFIPRLVSPSPVVFPSHPRIFNPQYPSPPPFAHVHAHPLVPSSSRGDSSAYRISPCLWGVCR